MAVCSEQMRQGVMSAEARDEADRFSMIANEKNKLGSETV